MFNSLKTKTERREENFREKENTPKEEDLLRVNLLSQVNQHLLSRKVKRQ